MRRRWVDRALVAGALVLVAVILAGALSRVSLGGHKPQAAPPAPTTTAAPQPAPEAHISIVVGNADIELHGTEMDVMRRCPADRLRVDLLPDQNVLIAYDGPPCHAPRLAIVALSRSPDGRATSRRPALSADALQPTLADGFVESISLAPGLLRCRSGPIELRAAGHGRVARGTIRCRGER